MNPSIFLTENLYQCVYKSDIIDVEKLVCDSRKADKNCAFFATADVCYENITYIREAVEKGAVVVVADSGRVTKKYLQEIRKCCMAYKASFYLVKRIRRALAGAAKVFYGKPDEGMTLIGITGTKGKTTTAFILKEMLTSAGIKTGMIGTNGIFYDSIREESRNTTPDAIECYRILAKMREQGIMTVIMEVSSQAMKMERVYGMYFRYGVFLNIGNDHISPKEHASMREYVRCKSRLFLQCEEAFLNAGDKYARYMKRHAAAQCHYYGGKGNTSLFVLRSSVTLKDGGLKSYFTTGGMESLEYELSIPGRFNIENALPALAIARSMGISYMIRKKALSQISLKGRMETVSMKNGAVFIIDYAHNAMSLQGLLISVREYCPKRIICIFGCGGNRAVSRRYEMGMVSGRYADITVITSDNPRDENPLTIMDMIEAGVKRTGGSYMRVTDRFEAVRTAYGMSRKGDILILAGKGHEDYQEINGVFYKMDERKMIEECNE